MPGRKQSSERGGAYPAVLITIGIALAVVAGARLVGDRMGEKYRCQGQAVAGIGAGGGAGGRCGGPTHPVEVGFAGIAEEPKSSGGWEFHPRNWDVEDIRVATGGFATATVLYKASGLLGMVGAAGVGITAGGWALLGLGTAAAVGGVTYAVMPESTQARIRNRLQQSWQDVGGAETWDGVQDAWYSFDEWAQKGAF